MRSVHDRPRVGCAMVACASIALVFSGCVGATDDSVDGDWASLADRPCPDDSLLAWESFGDPFVRSWCTGCHSEQLGHERRRGAPDDVNFNTLDDVRALSDRMWARAGDHNRTMPPAGGPGHAERELFGEWLACGAPSRPDLDR